MPLPEPAHVSGFVLVASTHLNETFPSTEAVLDLSRIAPTYAAEGYAGYHIWVWSGGFSDDDQLGMQINGDTSATYWWAHTVVAGGVTPTLANYEGSSDTKIVLSPIAQRNETMYDIDLQNITAWGKIGSCRQASGTRTTTDVPAQRVLDTQFGWGLPPVGGATPITSVRLFSVSGNNFNHTRIYVMARLNW